MKKIFALDIYILDNGAQPIADFCWEKFDISWLRLAYSCFGVFIVSNCYQLFAKKSIIFAIFVAFFICVFGFVLEQHKKFVSYKTLNPMRIINFPVRMIWLYGVIVAVIIYTYSASLFTFCNVLDNIMICSMYYFLSCQSRPPVIRESKQLVIQGI